MKGLLIAQIGNKRSESCSSYKYMYLEEDKNNQIFSHLIDKICYLQVQWTQAANYYVTFTKKKTTHTALQRNIEFSLEIIMQLCVTGLIIQTKF